MFVFLVFMLLVVVGLLAFIVSVYNKLVGLRNRTKNAFAQIDVQLKRRFDLIPNLVEVARKYLTHERETLEAVVQARAGAMQASQGLAQNPVDPEQMQKFLSAESLLKTNMMRFMAVAENYPELKANTTMAQLSEELTSTENKVAFSRQAFNDAVQIYNTATETFPNNIIAAFFSFKQAQLYVVESPQERQAVKVSFNT